MSFPRYPKYKASGVEWLGDVPAHWEVKRLRKIAEIRTGVAKGKDLGGVETVEIPYLRVANVQDGFVILDEVATMPVPKADVARLSLKRGDVLMNEGGDFDKLGRGCVWDGQIDPCITQNHVFAVRPHAASSEWVSLFTCSQSAQFFFMTMAKQSTNLASISSSNLMELPLPIPNPGEQEAIVKFLERETANIDALVAEQQRLIELLKEKRQAVISHAVTKGLDPNAKMKPSGIEWLGDVPAHWDVRRLKHVSPFLSVGIVINPSSLVADEGLPFIYGGDIREGVIDWVNARRIAPESSSLHAKTVLEDGDLLVVRVGAPGVTAVVPAECEGGNCASVMLIRRGRFNSRWLCSVMNTRVVRFQVEGVQYGAAQEQFNISDAVNFWVPVPPREEQDRIQAHCDKLVGQFDKLIESASMAIALLQERRTALISAAVTGQIDVRFFGEGTAAS